MSRFLVATATAFTILATGCEHTPDKPETDEVQLPHVPQVPLSETAKNSLLGAIHDPHKQGAGELARTEDKSRLLNYLESTGDKGELIVECVGEARIDITASNYPTRLQRLASDRDQRLLDVAEFDFENGTVVLQTKVRKLPRAIKLGGKPVEFMKTVECFTTEDSPMRGETVERQGLNNPDSTKEAECQPMEEWLMRTYKRVQKSLKHCDM